MAAKKPSMRKIDPKPSPKKPDLYTPGKRGPLTLESKPSTTNKPLPRKTVQMPRKPAPKKKDFFDKVGDVAGNVARGAYKVSPIGVAAGAARSKQGKRIIGDIKKQGGQAMSTAGAAAIYGAKTGAKYSLPGMVYGALSGSSKTKGKGGGFGQMLPGKPAPKKPGKPAPSKPAPKPKPKPKPKAKPLGPLGPEGQKPYREVPKGYKPNWDVPAGTPWKKDSPYNPANKPKPKPKPKPRPKPKPKPKPSPMPKLGGTETKKKK
jgi:hypothetical protein